MSPSPDATVSSHGQLSDRILVARACEGDDLAFGEIVRRYSGLMRAYTSRIVGSLSEADDIVQEAFVTAWKQLPTLRDASAVKAWLMRIAGREASAALRRRTSDATLDEGVGAQGPASADPEHIAVHNARLAALSRALGHLPDAQRNAWMLREIGGLSYDEIAAQLDVPASTVRGTLARARASIMIQMEGWR